MIFPRLADQSLVRANGDFGLKQKRGVGCPREQFVDYVNGVVVMRHYNPLLEHEIVDLKTPYRKAHFEAKLRQVLCSRQCDIALARALLRRVL